MAKCEICGETNSDPIQHFLKKPHKKYYCNSSETQVDDPESNFAATGHNDYMDQQGKKFNVK